MSGNAPYGGGMNNASSKAATFFDPNKGGVPRSCAGFSALPRAQPRLVRKV